MLGLMGGHQFGGHFCWGGQYPITCHGMTVHDCRDSIVVLSHVNSREEQNWRDKVAYSWQTIWISLLREKCIPQLKRTF